MPSLALWRRKPSSPPKQQSPQVHSHCSSNGCHRESPKPPGRRGFNAHLYQQPRNTGSNDLRRVLTILTMGMVMMWLLVCLLRTVSAGTSNKNIAPVVVVRSSPLSAAERTKLREVKAFLEGSSTSTSGVTGTTTLNNHYSDGSLPAPESEEWPYPLIHIVNTRFMQEQGHLKALGMARLHLFRTFCLPTMIHQSTQQFLWIIKTDPNVDPVILQQLVKDLQPYPNFYLVASNNNFMVRGRSRHDGDDSNNTTNEAWTAEMPLKERISWRDGAEPLDILRSTIYTGSRRLLWNAMMQKDRQVVLETRLDADDGLHRHYLRNIQEKAMTQFLPELGTSASHKHKAVTPKWLYWCAKRHVEWHGGARKIDTQNFHKTTYQQHPPTNLRGTTQTVSSNSEMVGTSNDTINTSDLDYYGGLLVVEHSRLCITPGLTVGFGIGTETHEVPIHSHDKLAKTIHQLSPRNACGYLHPGLCLEMVDDFMLMAVRARTPTSAGMQRVADDDDAATTDAKNDHKKPKKPKISASRVYLYWDLLHDDFAVLREQIKYTNQYILNHLIPIAKDNLVGQCTSDHSCKEDTKEKLIKIIEAKVN